MKKLLMSVAFIALVGSIVPADAGSTFAIGGGLNFGHVQTGTGAASHGTAAAGSLANGTNTNIGAGFAAATPARRHLDRGRSVCGSEQRRERRGLVRQRLRPSPAASPTTSVSVSAEASPTCCHNVDDSSMVANLRHHAADRVGVRCLIWWRCEGKEKLLLQRSSGWFGYSARSRMAFIGKLRQIRS